ncbi:MAG: phospholipase D-like domain-containing protein [Polyangiaceae bacterium]
MDERGPHDVVAGRRAQYEGFLQRVCERQKRDQQTIEAALGRAPDPSRAVNEAALDPGYDVLLESVANKLRPVLFVTEEGISLETPRSDLDEVRLLVERIEKASPKIQPVLPSIGRIDIEGGGTSWVATAWFIAEDILVTNRHVALQIARHDGRQFRFLPGWNGPIRASLGVGHLASRPLDPGPTHPIDSVLYVEPEGDGRPDIAFLRVRSPRGGGLPRAIPLADEVSKEVAVIGYPASGSPEHIRDQALMHEIYQRTYDVKRVAPGYVFAERGQTLLHDCTTLGGNSGSVLLDLEGRAVGLHYAGVYLVENKAVPLSVLRKYLRGQLWNEPYDVPPPVATRARTAVPVESPAPVSLARAEGPVSTFHVPVTITVQVGAPIPLTGGGAAVGTHPSIEDAAAAYWDARPPHVMAVRVGFLDDGERIGETPCIAVSVAPEALGQCQDGSFRGHPLRFFPANAVEQFEHRGLLETRGPTIQYDDDARQGEDYALDAVTEVMDIIAHVGPEYSWEVLEAFIEGTKSGSLVSSMYEFHARHIMNAIQDRLDERASVTLVLDRKTFGRIKDETYDFDRDKVFSQWSQRYPERFKYVVVPLGSTGLVLQAYHVKVSVRDEDTVWLSSGNWKAGTSQPLVDDSVRERAPKANLPGNREWHVVIKNQRLARRLRKHILQDLERSTELARGAPPERVEAREEAVYEPVESSEVSEVRRAEKLLPPREISGRIRVKPLLTPDDEGAVYADTVLRLIRSARESLLFQIPYIGMPSNPRAYRGFIDDLIAALVDRMKTIADARLILRSGGRALSSPNHAAWYLKSKGIDLERQVRVMEKHHTKGMVVDGKRVLLGSHNWSAAGVTLNRDASLLIDHREVAQYYAEAFRIDWGRANPIRPRRFVEHEAQGGGIELERVSLEDVLAEGG